MFDVSVFSNMIEAVGSTALKIAASGVVLYATIAVLRALLRKV